ncbi:hypothetical protein R9X47_03790 [Wukongibacter baidiensis]|uniref:hypothetical protein n=1 Tax=Wukongibacter baidiensis TaxID=1723361 RepID=UPI003D7FD47A
MAKKVNNYFNNNNKNNFMDIDCEELMRMVDSGYKTEEIAKALSVSKEQINNLKSEIDKYY